MSTREENHEYALAIIEAKNADIRVLQGAIHKLTSALIEAGVERSTLRAERDALRNIILWALGENGAFPDPVEAKPRRLYWWRPEMRSRLDAALAVQPTTGEGV